MWYYIYTLSVIQILKSELLRIMLLTSKNKLFILSMMLVGCTVVEPSNNNNLVSTPIPNTNTTPKMDCQVIHPKLYGHYVGDCQNGKAHGQGFAVGKDKYEGSFSNGLPDGQGTYTWADTKSFVGQFSNGSPQVPHTGCYVADSRLRGSYSGECKNNKANGRGLAKGIDTYSGNFINGVTNGQGTYVWPNGDRYLGEFKNGNAHGRGEMRYVDGAKEAGFWQDGQMFKEFPANK